VRTPTWGEIEAFLVADAGWSLVRGTGHDFYEKALPDGTVLQTHVSHSRNKSMHPDTFKHLICAQQLQATEAQFWATISAGRSQRAGAVEPAAKPEKLTLALIQELRRRLHYTDEQFEGLTGTEAKRRLREFHERAAERREP
jgi:hypothetical protein